MSIDRRQLLRVLGSASLTTTLAPGLGSATGQGTPKFSADPFSLGVAAGEPAADGFVVWTRLAPKPLEVGGGMPQRPVEVAWVVATEETMRGTVAAGVVLAHPDNSHSAHVEVAGLAPGREYFYRFTAGGIQSPVGRAKTLPASGQEGVVRFASAGCQRYEDGYFTAWRKIADERLDFVIHYGDYIYEYKAIDVGAERDHPVIRAMPGHPPKCRTLDEFRNRYAIYKLDKDLQAAHASTAFIMSFDDHEVENNWAGSHGLREHGSARAFQARRAAAFKAWYEHMPLRRAQAPSGPDILAYRRFAVGGLLQMDVLDTRQYRSEQPCGNGWKSCPDAKDAARTMLGPVQESWLYDGFRRSTARWNVLAQQVPIARLVQSANASTVKAHMDKWDGAEAARGRLLDAVSASKVRNAVVLAGDVHHHRASELRRNFDDDISPTLGVEFVATSISSGGDGGAARRKAAQLIATNPHLRFYNDQRGFVRHTVSRTQWRADCVTLDNVSTPAGVATDPASFVVEAGRAKLARA